MERIQTAEISSPTILIDCTPKELRELADKMEIAASRAIPGSSLVTKFSKSVSLHFRVKDGFTFVGANYRDSEVVSERLVGMN
jgi:hypothetical protein